MTQVMKLAIIDLQTRINKGAEIIYITRLDKKATQIKEPDLTNCVLLETTKQGNVIKEIYIKHPYKSKKIDINYYNDEKYLTTAKHDWSDALERVHPTATVLVVNNKVIGKAGNGLTYHTLKTCERKKLNMPTGQGYHMCNGNHLPENHSEPKAIRNAMQEGNSKLLNGATAYLYGHWWSCKDCSDAMEKAGIKKLYLSREWTKEFLQV
jgi:deoxycytidylate deaminase